MHNHLCSMQHAAVSKTSICRHFLARECSVVIKADAIMHCMHLLIFEPCWGGPVRIEWLLCMGTGHVLHGNWAVQQMSVSWQFVIASELHGNCAYAGKVCMKM